MLTRKYLLSIQTHGMTSAAYAWPIINDVFAVKKYLDFVNKQLCLAKLGYCEHMMRILHPFKGPQRRYYLLKISSIGVCLPCLNTSLLLC